MTFFSNIVHEIKTPLTLIRTPLQNILASESCSEEAREDLMVINNNTEYLSQLVKELLDFVKIECHGYMLNCGNLDLIDRCIKGKCQGDIACHVIPVHGNQTFSATCPSVPYSHIGCSYGTGCTGCAACKIDAFCMFRCQINCRFLIFIFHENLHSCA